MGITGLSIAASGAGDRAAAQREIWARVRSFALTYSGGPSHVDIFEAYLDNVDPCESVDGSALTWRFNDLGGSARRSARAWHHWLRRAIDVEWDAVVAIAARHGLTLAERPAAPPTTVRFLQLDDELWIAEPDGLYGDDRYRDLAELTSAQLQRHARALEQCQCRLCDRLRPTPPS